MNYHTYGNLLIYPWGYLDDFLTPDSTLFFKLGDRMTAFNGYFCRHGKSDSGL